MTAYQCLQSSEFRESGSGLRRPTFGTDHFDMVAQPNSPYGNGLGFDGSVRIIQLSGKLIF